MVTMAIFNKMVNESKDDCMISAEHYIIYEFRQINIRFHTIHIRSLRFTMDFFYSVLKVH